MNITNTSRIRAADEAHAASYPRIRCSLIFVYALAVSGLFTRDAGAALIQFDFVQAAKNNEHGAIQMIFTEGGLTLTATGVANNDNDPIQYAYLDDAKKKGPGGLAVCKDIKASLKAKPLKDDNVSEGEILTLIFNQQVTLDAIVFNDHGRIFELAARIDIATDGAFANYPLTNNFTTPLTGTRFDFRYPAVDGSQFYLGALTLTPEPGTLSLALLAISCLVRKGCRGRTLSGI